MLDLSKARLLDPALIRKRAAGLTVEQKAALLHVPMGANHIIREKALQAGTKQWVERMAKEGWKVESKAEVRLIPRADEHYRPVLDSEAKVTLWKPHYHGMRDDHPFLRPGHDALRITAWFSRQPRAATIEVSDSALQRLIDKGRVPAGLTVT